MPKTINQETIREIVRLREEEGLNFKVIGKMLGMHENTVSAHYRSETESSAPAASSSVAIETKEKLVAIRQDMHDAIQKVQGYLADETFGKEMQTRLVAHKIFTEALVVGREESAIAAFKQRFGLDRFAQDELLEVSDAWAQIFNEVLCSEFTEKDAIGYFASMFQEKDTLSQRVSFLREQQNVLNKAICELEQKITGCNDELVKLAAFKMALISSRR
ncbi:hypothetical protein HYX13_04350 [Candidatus Woesearchaeota archaeon]|nr:hypothetical protein [Candidatus Woesearchaeota archaeon]